MKKILLAMCFFASVAISAQITSAAAGDWDAGATWVGGVKPTSADDVVVNHAVRVRKNITAEMKSLTVGGSPGQLRIDNESIVKVTNSVDITRNQDGIAFYAQGGPLGSFTYGSVGATTASSKRIYLRARMKANNKWSLVTSPLNDSRVNEIISVNGANSVIATSGGDIGLASYNDANGANLKYVYYQTADNPFANTEHLTEGKGYAVRTNNSNASKPDIIQRGLLITTFPVNLAITDGGNGFNLLGNPLMGNLNVNDAADGTNNILRVNGANGTNILAEDTIWLWDTVNDTWVTHNLNSASYKMPGVQGYFVKAKAGGGTFTVTKAMQSDTGGAFLKSSSTSNRFEIDLTVAVGKKKRSTSIIYSNNATADFDNGYDSSTFGGYASSFEVYTNLVGKDSGKKLAIQSLPNANFEDMIIPVGVTANANSEITFSAKAVNVPTGYKVFLEDRLNGAFTRLDVVDAEYTATVTEKSTEGRFYLHARSSALSLDSELLNSVRIFKSNTSTLKIVGLSQGKTNVSLYNVIGEQVLKASFNANGTKEISLPRLSKGVYIVQLETETGKVNKKIVLE